MTMTTPMSLTMVLSGHYTGHTGWLANHPFENGVCVLNVSPANMGHAMTLLAKYQAYPEGSNQLITAQKLWVEFLATEEGLEKYGDSAVSRISAGSIPSDVRAVEPGAETLSAVSGDRPSEANPSSGDNNPSGSGHTDARISTEPTAIDSEASEPASAPVDTKLVKILEALDPSNDSHWTQGGLPRITVIEEAYGGAGVLRGDIENAVPGLNREDALAAETVDVAEDLSEL